MVTPGLLAANIAIAVAITLLLIIVLDIDPAVSLIIGSLYMGIASGLGPNETVATIAEGFGNLMQGIGIPIIFGIMIGMLLAQCEGARKIAVTLTSAVPSRYVPYALGLSGALVAVPVFFDVAFLVLIPIVIALWQETEVSYPAMIGSLVIGAAGAHTFIPPTPNPLAAPELLSFSLGEMMVTGLIVGFPAVILTIALYIRIVNRLWDEENDLGASPLRKQKTKENRPRVRHFSLHYCRLLRRFFSFCCRQVHKRLRVNQTFILSSWGAGLSLCLPDW